MSDSPFLDLTTKYFRQKGYEIGKGVILEGFSGLPRKFDLFIRKGNEQRLVWIKDWKRTARAMKSKALAY